MEYYIVINIIFPLRESWHSVRHAVCRVRAPCVWTLSLREEKRNVMNWQDGHNRKLLLSPNAFANSSTMPTL